MPAPVRLVDGVRARFRGRRAEGEPLSWTDENLVEQMAEGDRAAFAALYDRHAPRVLGLLVVLVRDRSAAEDVLHDAFVEVWKRASQFDRLRASVVAWLAVIARSRGLDYLRKQSRTTTVADTPEVPVFDDPSPRLEENETAAAARLALKALPEEQRTAIELAYYGGLTHDAIAKRTGQPLGTIKTRIRLGMRRLREALVEAD